MRIVVVAVLMISSLAYAGEPATTLRKLVDVQVKWARDGGFDDDKGTWLAPGGRIFATEPAAALDADALGRMINGEGIRNYSVGNFVTRVAPDGGAALMSFTLHVGWRVSANDPDLTEVHDYRATQIAMKEKQGWRITAGLWSEAWPNAEVNERAKAGKLSLEKLQAGGDQSVLDAFQKLATGELDAAAGTRKDLVAFGSGPKERTVGGASLARAWKAGWANKLTIDSALGSTSGAKDTLGYVIATITLAKKDYKIPFKVMFVFERKTESDPWSLVHAHFAVPEPPP